MHKLILASLAAVLLTGLPARADQVTGTIIALDVVEQQLVLGDGSVYTLPKSVAAAKLALGSKVEGDLHIVRRYQHGDRGRWGEVAGNILVKEAEIGLGWGRGRNETELRSASCYRQPG
jgi:hypothetical protein